MSKLKLFWVRLTHWEYWPFNIVYIPIFFYWFYLSIKARSLFFFSASNPSIETGGMMGESKYDILKNIPLEYLPRSIFINSGTPIPELSDIMKKENLNFPVIVKPDVGQRGIKVEKISSFQELEYYFSKIKVDVIIQEFIDLPSEAGIFYFRHPDWKRGIVSSVVIKEYLKVTGDGRSTISELMLRYPRAAFQFERLSSEKSKLMNFVPAINEEVLLEPIGNHSRGTMFMNGNHLIDEHLTDVFDKISKCIDGFYFGRFDLKFSNEEDLKQGKNIKILELNGAGAEPAHIYHPGSSILKAYKSLFYHWRHLFEISKKNRKLGHTYMTFKEVRKKYLWLKEYNKKLS